VSGWAKGDLALCVSSSFKALFGADPLKAPRRGGVYLVTGTELWNGDAYLFLGEVPHPALAAFFRKINPLTDAERRQALADLGERVGEQVL